MEPTAATYGGVEYRRFDRLYWVSKCGKVIRNGSVYSPKRRPQGYACCGRQRLLHRMVATVWIRPPEPGEHCHHINHDKLDNRAENLEWISTRAHLLERHPDAVQRFAHSRLSPEGKAKLRALRLGTKMSDETKAKIGASVKARGARPPSRKGYKRAPSEIAWMFERHHRWQACIVNGVRYKSFADAGKALGIRPLTLRKRCLSPSFPDYQLAS